MPPGAPRNGKRPAASRDADNTGDEGSNGPEQRKLRNRMSQRAFRARQAMRIQELEERLEKTSTPAELQDQNAKLRQQLMEIHKKAVSIQISLKAVADSAAQALGMENVPLDSFVTAIDSRERSVSGKAASATPGSTIELARASDRMNVPTSNPEAYVPEGYGHEHAASSQTIRDGGAGIHSALQEQRWHNFNPNYSSSNFGAPGPVFQYTDNLPMGKSHSTANGFVQQAMSLMPLQSSQLGPERYQDLVERSMAHGNMSLVKRTNSIFSDHIDTYEPCLAHHSTFAAKRHLGDEKLASAISCVVQAFANNTWQSATAWDTRTFTNLQALTAWRMNRTEMNWRRIIPHFRPTEIQTFSAHPSIIDWMPWPSIRDNLIIYHSANPKLDQIIDDIGSCWAIEADLSQLIKCPTPVVGFVPLWPLVHTVTASNCHSDSPNNVCHHACNTRVSSGDEGWATRSASEAGSDGSGKLPAASVEELYSSATLARAAFQVLGLGIRTYNDYRLDPVLFERYPELFDSQADVMARGVRLGLPPRFTVSLHSSVPPVDPSVVAQYRELSAASLGSVTAEVA
ncbi:hypothetical protein CB0940_08981 [Cercospora beticola]|uniref:BZIP domain-containing protein n=1 Tax=Cercospora beticola TaxID=122368 RepID=A0A2G5HQU0_CERBT|nr:hypothetical protein CB0940_08981 [Cercospora beticola]PIA94602.1 hypothetical protein CB0940_08981 [Cercospora beticola]WPB05579.1 hypothetical protein RHO25_010232 [Cercospora beticola]